MLLTNKHFTPVIGLDIHIVILFGFPIPLPHPYIGFVLDPMDYVPFIGATTKINHVPRGKSDTSGIIIILFHIPMGGPFLLAPMIGHDSVNFFGSKKVKVEGTMMSPSGHMLMTCNDIGLPLSMHPGKKMKPIPSMYLPTSFSIPLSFGKPVMVGGPFVPDWEGALLNLVMSYGFGSLMKGLGKLGRGTLKKFNRSLQNKLGSNKLSKFLCKKGFEPVDLVQGIVIYDGIDFELPGPLPLKWTRSWNSDSKHNGLLGHGTHAAYDMRILEYEGVTVVLLGDGRSAIFEDDYNRHERLTLTRTAQNEYQLFDHTERIYYHFKQSRLYSIVNEAGFIISFHYNLKDHLTKIIDSTGRELQVESDKQGRITSISVFNKELIRYGYNEAGDLTGITDALQQTTHIQYHNHQMIAKTDRNGQTFYWEYTEGRCTHTWGDGGIFEGWIEYHPSEGYNLVTNSLGQTTTYYYTPDFIVTQIKDPLGFSKFFEYTEHMEIYREIDEEGNMTGYSYDDRGNRTSVVQPSGSTYSFSYDAADRLILSTVPAGDSRTYIYSRKTGLLHTITEADGSMSILYYNQHNLLERIEDEQGRGSFLEYDTAYNLIALTLADGSRSTWKYDKLGRCISASNPLKQEQIFAYDALGRVTTVDLPDGNHVQMQYDAYEDVLQTTDKYSSVGFAYTPLGGLKMREENGVKTHYLYNNEEQLTGLVNERGEMYRFVRNGRGDIIQETGFDGITQYFKRDGAGKVIRVERPDKCWTEYEYDFNGRLTRAEYSDGSWDTYSYNLNGQLIEATNEFSQLKFQRDVMGRVLQEWQNGHTVSSSYGRNGRRSKLKSSLGANIQFTRNHLGEVITMEAGPWTAHIERNLLGLEIERTLPGGVKSSWTYDKAGMPASHSVHTGERRSRQRDYRWDANQRLKQIQNVVKFGYDEIGSLAWAQYEDGEYDYRLPDRAGLLYKTKERTDRKYSAGGRLEEIASERLVYDEEGNLHRKSGAVYEWYGNGMLKKVIRKDGQEVKFRYDPLGRRIEKEYKGMLTRFVWDGNVPLHEWKYPEKERPVVNMGESGLQDSAEPVTDMTTWIFEEGAYVPAAKLINGKQYSIITDHLGTPCEVYNESGESIWKCELDIYGKVRKLAGDKSLIPFRYQGQYEDEETGLYYNRYRYYDPVTGGFISKDPLGLAGGYNPYKYVEDVNSLIDPLGLKDCFANKSAEAMAEKIIQKHGGVKVKEGHYAFPNRRSARKAASEIAGDLGGDRKIVRKRDFRGGPRGWENSDAKIGVYNRDKTAGWRDDSPGHRFGDEVIPPHVNAWNESKGVFDNLHLIYGD